MYCKICAIELYIEEEEHGVCNDCVEGLPKPTSCPICGSETLVSSRYITRRRVLTEEGLLLPVRDYPKIEKMLASEHLDPDFVFERIDCVSCENDVTMHVKNDAHSQA